MSKSEKLLDLLDEFESEDVAEIEEEIIRTQARLTLLHTVLKIVKSGNNNQATEHKRPGPPTRNGAPGPTERKEQIAKFLILNGPSTPKTLREKLNLTTSQLYPTIQDAEWFDNESGTYSITNAMRQKLSPKSDD